MINEIEIRHVLHARESVGQVEFHSQKNECIRLEVADDWLIVYMDESTASGLLEELERALADVKSQRYDREREDD